jgi:HAUS augmin-like complex subunit 1
MDHLTPTDLFSPSKARQQRAQAQDWAQIDSWLSYQYAGRTVPTFERNEDTLRVLRELSVASERADEERGVQERLERAALKELELELEQVDSEDARILEAVTAHLTPSGSEALTALASTAVHLNAPSPNAETVAHALIKHSTACQKLSNQLAHVHALDRYLEKQQSLLRIQLHELQSDPAFSTPLVLQRQSTDQLRQTKHLRAKIREAEDKLSSLQAGQGRATAGRGGQVTSAESIMEMLEQQKELDEWRGKVERLEGHVAAFADLPADREAARKEVGKLEVELDRLRRKRDAMFEGLVGR